MFIYFKCFLGSNCEDNFLSNTVNVQKMDKNSFSVYRTPSGKYYCQICNLTLNSEAQFKTHLGSKNHFKKASTQQTQQK